MKYIALFLTVITVFFCVLAAYVVEPSPPPAIRHRQPTPSVDAETAEYFDKIELARKTRFKVAMFDVLESSVGVLAGVLSGTAAAFLGLTVYLYYRWIHKNYGMRQLADDDTGN